LRSRTLSTIVWTSSRTMQPHPGTERVFVRLPLLWFLRISSELSRKIQESELQKKTVQFIVSMPSSGTDRRQVLTSLSATLIRERSSADSFRTEYPTSAP